jgi:hypothetical protein
LLREVACYGFRILIQAAHGPVTTDSFPSSEGTNLPKISRQRRD